jgi:hypothetical protein
MQRVRQPGTSLLVAAAVLLAVSRVANAEDAPVTANTAHARATTQALAIPSAEGLLLLVRTTMITIDQANKTDNYSVLRATGGPGLQTYSAAQLAKIFEPLRLNKVDLGSTAVVTPELGDRPSLSAQGLLTLAGVFQTRPMQTQFRFVYEPDHGSWKPFGLSVTMMPAATGAGRAASHIRERTAPSQ